MKPNIRRIWRFFLFFFWWVSKILHRWVVSFPWAEPIKPYYNFFFFLTPGDWKPSKPLHFLFLKKLIRFLAKISPVKQTLLGTQGIAACACVSSSSLSLSLFRRLCRAIASPLNLPFAAYLLNEIQTVRFIFLRFLVHISAAFCLRKDWCDRSRKYTLLIIITTRRCVFLVEQEGKGGVPGFEFAGFFFLRFLVHISVVILVAEGSARSKSEGEIIDHHR